MTKTPPKVGKQTEAQLMVAMGSGIDSTSTSILTFSLLVSLVRMSRISKVSE